MSMLSGLSSHIDEEGQLLHSLNDAVLCVQAAILGELDLLGLSKDDLRKSSTVLVDFLEKLRKALKVPPDDPTISMLLDNIRQESDKTIDEWEEDIQELIVCIGDKKLKDHPSLLQILEDILNLLNADYSEAVRALYYKYR